MTVETHEGDKETYKTNLMFLALNNIENDGIVGNIIVTPCSKTEMRNLYDVMGRNIYVLSKSLATAHNLPVWWWKLLLLKNVFFGSKKDNS